MISYKLYAVTDRSWLREGETLAGAVRDAILGGATVVQLREKELPEEEFKELALSVKKVCNAYNVTFLINDNVKLAKEVDADGAHIGLNDMTVYMARKILGDNKIVGVTAASVAEAKEAEKAGADYLGSGAIFGSDTKKDASKLSPQVLSEICNSVKIPVVTIGGINAYNVSALRSTKIAGVAVASGIFAEKNKTRASRDIIANLYGNPIVHTITNHVTANGVANMIHAFGCSPIMAHNANEVEEVQEDASALLINLGATDDYNAIRRAYRTAIEEEHIITIDPVGVSGIRYRLNFLMELLEIGRPTCIRGNYSEIMAIYNKDVTGSGLDSSIENVDIKDITQKLAKELDTIVVASGTIDIVSNGKNVTEIQSGHPLQKKLTGSGCMLSAGICSALSVGAINYCGISNKKLIITASTCKEIGDAAYIAAEKTLEADKGIYSFQTAWFDELY